MSFVRPEARATLWRWREVLAGAALGVLGAWLATGYGLTVWLGYAALLAAAALAVIGVQRARFRTGGGGPGVVQFDEGAVGYLGPLTGGAVALADLTRLTLDQTSHPAHWVLEAPGQPPLAIPVTAEGADMLFDAFATLPGFPTGRMLSALRAASASGPGAHQVVIWQSAQEAATIRRLH